MATFTFAFLCIVFSLMADSCRGQCMPSETYANVDGMTDWCIANCGQGYCPETHCDAACLVTTTPPPGSPCAPTETYEDVDGMTDWCTANCGQGYCPTSHCNAACQALYSPSK